MSHEVQHGHSPQRFRARAVPSHFDVRERALRFETTFREPTVRVRKETAPSFMEQMMAAKTMTKANDGMNGSAAKSDSDTTDYKPGPPSKPVARPLSTKK